MRKNVWRVDEIIDFFGNYCSAKARNCYMEEYISVLSLGEKISPQAFMSQKIIEMNIKQIRSLQSKIRRHACDEIVVRNLEEDKQMSVHAFLAVRYLIEEVESILSLKRLEKQSRDLKIMVLYGKLKTSHIETAKKIINDMDETIVFSVSKTQTNQFVDNLKQAYQVYLKRNRSK